MAITVLLCYAHEDVRMVVKLKKHLSSLVKSERIVLWDSGDISPGAERKQEIDKHLNEAQIILLLMSSDFLDSHYCYSIAMQRAIERHEHKEARVIPIILRPVYWQEPPLDKLQVLPDNAKPIINWTPRDNGFKNVVDGLAKVIGQWNSHSLSGPIAERRALMLNLDQLIEMVKSQMQPTERATPTANTLQHLSIFIPNEVTLADLVVGWQTLSRSSKQEEELATARRRITCGELANLASQCTVDQGNLAQAIKTWRIWRDAFKNSDDPRQISMTKTFARELTELQDAMS